MLLTLQRVVDRLGHRLVRHRDFQPDRLGRLVQPVEVLLEPEDLAAVAAQALEHAVAVEQAVVVDADLGVFLVEQLAADVDLEATWRARRLDANGGSRRRVGRTAQRLQSPTGSSAVGDCSVASMPTPTRLGLRPAARSGRPGRRSAVVRHHDYSEVLLGGSRFAESPGFPRRSC